MLNVLVSVLIVCDGACMGGCTAKGPAHCRECADGYSKDDQGVCVDVDECLDQTAQCDGEKKVSYYL